MENCRQSLQKAFLNILAQKPFEKITIKEIIAEANVSRTSYYRLYYSTINILNDILDTFFNGIDSVRVKNNASFSFVPEADYKYVSIVYQMLLCYRENVSELKIILNSSVCNVFEKRLYDYIFPSFNTWLKPTDRYSIDYVNGPFYEFYKRFFTAGFVRILCDWILDDCRKEPEEILHFIIRLSKLTATYIDDTALEM